MFRRKPAIGDVPELGIFLRHIILKKLKRSMDNRRFRSRSLTGGWMPSELRHRGQSTEPPSMVLRRKDYENENRGLAGSYRFR